MTQRSLCTPSKKVQSQKTKMIVDTAVASNTISVLTLFLIHYMIIPTKSLELRKNK